MQVKVLSIRILNIVSETAKRIISNIQRKRINVKAHTPRMPAISRWDV